MAKQKKQGVSEAQEAYRIAKKELSKAQTAFDMAEHQRKNAGIDETRWREAEARLKAAIKTNDTTAKQLEQTKYQELQDRKKHCFSANGKIESCYVKFQESRQAHRRANEHVKELSKQLSDKFRELTELRKADDKAIERQNTIGITLSEEIDAVKTELRKLNAEYQSAKELENECLRTCKFCESTLFKELKGVYASKQKRALDLLEELQVLIKEIEKEKSYASTLLGKRIGQSIRTQNLSLLISDLKGGV